MTFIIGSSTFKIGNKNLNQQLITHINKLYILNRLYFKPLMNFSKTKNISVIKEGEVVTVLHYINKLLFNK